MIRPGRVDLKEYIGWCSKSQIEKMFLRFYDGEDAKSQATQFSDRVASFNKNVSPAQIQGFFMFHKNSNPEQVINDCKLIWEL